MVRIIQLLALAIGLYLRGNEALRLGLEGKPEGMSVTKCSSAN
jgi:hypothetical protein